MTIRNVPSKGRMSIIKIQNFTIEKRHSVIRLVYGAILVIATIITIAVDPLELATNWVMEPREGSYVFRMWQNPTFEVFSEIYVFNYTNVPEYLRGDDKVLRLQEIGPFVYQELRTNENITIDKERGVMKMHPKVSLKFVPERSFADSKKVKITVPNIVLLALSTLAADNLGYFANAGAYYSVSALGSKLFLNLTVEEYLWGYDDPLVTIASSLLPGWIDFSSIGIMDRFYAHKDVTVEMELKDVKTKYSINSWNDKAGLVEQGFTDLNTSNLCNRLKGAYEGLLMSPKLEKDKVLHIFRKQACRIFPFTFEKEISGDYGFTHYRYTMERSAFNRTSPYACECRSNCLPDGFVDVSKCFYGFPIALSKPHFLDVDPEQASYFDGMKPDKEKHTSRMDIEPNVGVPMSIASSMQVNLAVRMSPANPITKPLKKKIVPLVWILLFCKQPPPDVITILRLRFVIAPPLLICVEVLLFIIGMVLGAKGFYRILKPQYKLLQSKPNINRRKSSVAINISDNKAFKDDDEMAKEAVSLLAIKEDVELPDLLISDNLESFN